MNHIGIWISVLLLGGLIWWMCGNRAEWERQCKARGGHEKSVYKGTLCVSADGRIIEW